MSNSTELQCRVPGCTAIKEDQDGLEVGLCALHRQEARVRRGACLNCGGDLVATEEINQLTGKPLKRDGEPVLVHTCAEGCGYSRRQRPHKKGRLRT